MDQAANTVPDPSLERVSTESGILDIKRFPFEVIMKLQEMTFKIWINREQVGNSADIWHLLCIMMSNLDMRSCDLEFFFVSLQKKIEGEVEVILII